MDICIVAASFVLTYFAARGLGAPGPGTWAVMVALAMSTWRLNSAGLQWSHLGLRMPGSALRALAWVVALYGASVLLVTVVVDPLARLAGWPPLNLSRFAGLPGNAGVLAGYLLLAWGSAAFAEELVFRGFLLTRIEVLLGGGAAATAIAVAAQALLFGAAHYYLGWRGIATAALVGSLCGIVYLCAGRNLVPLIVAHGVTDSLSLIAIYSRMVPVT